MDAFSLSNENLSKLAHHHANPYVGASHARSWSPLLVLGAILWALVAKN